MTLKIAKRWRWRIYDKKQFIYSAGIIIYLLVFASCNVNKPLPPVAPTATGGIVTTNNGYTYHTFTNDGIFEVRGGCLNVSIVIIEGYE